MQLDYPNLLLLLAKRMDPKYSSLTLPLVKAALRGEFVDSTATPDGLKTGEYLAMGYFLNALEADKPTEFIPKISPLLLFMFAMKYVKRSTGSVV